jgi:hypothetical protein
MPHTPNEIVVPIHSQHEFEIRAALQQLLTEHAREKGQPYALRVESVAVGVGAYNVALWALREERP